MKWYFPRPPFEVQTVALKKSRDQEGWGHFLEQGLGKTSLTLNEFFDMRERGLVSYLLVTAPNSFKEEWKVEAENAVPEVRVPVLVYESGKSDLAKFVKSNPGGWIVIVNPEALITAKFDAASKLLSGKKVLYTWDESIKLKNNKGAITRRALKHADACGFTRALSGKITTQGPHDLWGQLRFIKRCKDINYYQFRGRYCIMGGFSGWQVIGTRNEEELRRNLEDCCFIARKKDWSDLPEKLYMAPRTVAMLPGQKKIYDIMLKEFFVELSGQDKMSIRQLVTRDLKLHQIKSGFIVDEAGKVQELVPHDRNPRLNFCEEYLEEIEGKLVIVALFKYSIAALLERLKEYNPAVITGGMKGDDIQANKKRFNEDDSCRVIVLQQQASKFGHTLLGSEAMPCTSMLMYEQSYSLDDRSQIEDRIHRWGQTGACTYQDISMSPLDRAVIRSLQRKEDIAAAVMGYGRESGLLPPSARVSAFEDVERAKRRV